jgi:hypothetical protein
MRPEIEIDAQNAATSAKEVAAFKARKVPHRKYSAYLTRDTKPETILDTRSMAGAHRITTWTGDTLALVTAIKFRRERNSFNTDTRGSFWARGIDGRLYFGTHNGVGMYCRMRLAKNQGMQP